MYTVEIVKKCGCFTKSGLDAEFKFDSLHEANKKAEELAQKFNNEFCEKHKFKIQTEGSVIKVIEDEEC